MQNTLNVAAPVSAPAKTNFCHPNNAPKTTATITREKTTIVIQKSETFHAENRENLENIVIFTSNIGSLPKLKRTTSDIGKSILLGGAKVRPTKQKSDYSISSRKRNSRGLYENYNEVYEELQSEQSPLLNIPSAREEISVRKDENSVLVYTTKRTSLPGANARHSWYAPVYRVLEEEGEGSSNVKESASLHNLAGVKKLAINGTHESASLLDNHQHSTPQTVVPRPAAVVCIVPSGNPENGGPSLGATASRKRKFEQFLKNLVSRRASKEPPSPPLITNSTAAIAAPVELSLKTSKRSPSEQNLTRSRLNGSTASLSDSVHQKLWSVVPLLRKNGSLQHISRNQPSSSSHMHRPPTFADIEYTGLRKCETVLALTTPHTEPIRPLNRLRHCASIATCSRCSSLLSLAAGSKYSLNCGVFIPVSSSGNLCTRSKDSGAEFTDDTSTVLEKEPEPEAPEVATTKFVCKLCLGEYTAENLTEISQCGCSFCTECMTAYVEFEIAEGAYEVSCPDAMCPAQGVISLAEIALLAASSLVEKHHRYRLNREVELDKYRTWCPKAGCETICLVGPTSLSPSPSTEKVVTFQPSSSKIPNPVAVHCPTCCDDFCSGCKKSWHPSMTCEENTKQLAATGKIETLGIPFDSDLIKCCPMCSVPIEKDEGCAQMMCKRCKHVFCWYCLASLDDDFLLRHYDKGPCKNKLGHSRASVVWHRAQVIGIFAGFGILLLVASPLLLLAAPCIVCCKCRICSGAAKMEDHDTDLDDGITLQR